MDNESSRNTIDNFLGGLHDRATESFSRGNRTAARYLACICGMWSHYAHLNENLFTNNDSSLYEFFNVGFDASEEAIKMNEVLNKAFSDFEKRRAEKIKQAKQKKK